VGPTHVPPTILETPIAYVTRAEAVTALLLVRGATLPTLKNTGRFPDVKPGDWFEPYLLSAETFGIIAADPKTRELRPNQSVNRAEYLKLLTLTFGLPTNLPQSFTDVPKNSWYAAYAGLAQHYLLFPSGDGQQLGPNRILNEDEALHALTIIEQVTMHTQDVSAEQREALQQSQNHLAIYSVISTRRTNVVLMSTTEQTPPPPPVTTPPVALPQLRAEVIALVNTARKQAGLAPLKYSVQLEQSAQGYAQLMSTEGFFGHVSPAGQTLKDRIAATGYYDRTFSADCNCVKGFALGENLARGQKTAEEVMHDWMASPAHKAAILNGDYTDVGIGVSAGIWVEHFGGVLLPSKLEIGLKK
jgi:uncharacterized protein YkwD